MTLPGRNYYEVYLLVLTIGWAATSCAPRSPGCASGYGTRECPFLGGWQ
ncbi:MAG: hypothetical protein ACRDSF_00620 [Pseudonocardiaceae bacterium]